MGKGQQRKRKASAGQKALRWRETRIKSWRKGSDITHQKLADKLAEHGFALDRVSVLRIEAGKQMPSIEVLEAMARILGAPNVSALTDYTPEEWTRLAEFAAMSPREQQRVLRIARAAGDG